MSYKPCASRNTNPKHGPRSRLNGVKPKTAEHVTAHVTAHITAPPTWGELMPACLFILGIFMLATIGLKCNPPSPKEQRRLHDAQVERYLQKKLDEGDPSKLDWGDW